MRNIHEETLAELREIAEVGTDHLRKRVRVYTPVSPTKEYRPLEKEAPTLNKYVLAEA
jgi:hypothetical protein